MAMINSFIKNMPNNKRNKSKNKQRGPNYT